MKIVTTGPASGKIGNVVTSRNRFGSYQRVLAKPTNPNTIDQQSQRNIFQSIASAWRGLTEDQRLQWEALAAQLPRSSVFSSSPLTGFQVFMQVNCVRLTAGQAVYTDPPLPPSFDVLSITGATSTVGDHDHPSAIKLTGVVRNAINTAPDIYFVAG